ncbi:MAG: hypothetical protein GMKNLPBB_03316 [Myxococcota bacterium]|nr:hypothetical protein [Myxococcota bacterium]
MLNFELRTPGGRRSRLWKALMIAAVVALVIGSSVWLTIDANGQSGLALQRNISSSPVCC